MSLTAVSYTHLDVYKRQHTPSGSSANKRRDWHWFYNAGFASIRLLGQLQDLSLINIS